MMHPLLAAGNARERMDALEAFIAFWYGPQHPEYRETEEELSRYPLPYPLRRFYAFAGCRPYLDEFDAEDFFYTGMASHHLYEIDTLAVRPDGKLEFFNEYQGDWKGLTLLAEEDPPVWIHGNWDLEENSEPQVKMASDQLSKFLVTHCLLTSLYEDANCLQSSWDPRLSARFQRERDLAVEIWNAEDIDCPWYGGHIYLFRGDILVHEFEGRQRFGAVHPEGIAWITQELTAPPS